MLQKAIVGALDPALKQAMDELGFLISDRMDKFISAKTQNVKSHFRKKIKTLILKKQRLAMTIPVP